MADIREDSFLTRRELLEQCGFGLGALAITSLLDDKALASFTQHATNPLAPKPAFRLPH